MAASGFLNVYNLYFFFRFSFTEVAIDQIPMKVPQQPAQFLSTMQQSQFLECDLKQARRFYSEYGEDMSPDAVLFRQQARKLVAVAKQALDELGVRFWLSSGTCLGRTRLIYGLNINAL